MCLATVCVMSHLQDQMLASTAARCKFTKLESMQVSLSQVFMGMKQAQHQRLFTVLDWGVANAKLEEVMPSPTTVLLHCSPPIVVLCLSVGCQTRANHCYVCARLVHDAWDHHTQARSGQPDVTHCHADCGLSSRINLPHNTLLMCRFSSSLPRALVLRVATNLHQT